MAVHLAYRAAHRVRQAFTQATLASYTRKFRLFVAFIQIQLHQLTPVILLSFLEFLTENGVSNSAIANHISAVKTSLTMHGVSTLAFHDQTIKLFQKSLALKKKITAKVKKIINVNLLKNIVDICDTMWMGQIFKALYLIAFFSFLHISNLVPHNCSFSPLVQRTRGDVFFAPPGLHIVVK